MSPSAIAILRNALSKAKTRGVDVNFVPDHVSGHLFEFTMPDNSGGVIAISIDKTGSKSFSEGDVTFHNGISIVRNTDDVESTYILMFDVIEYLYTL